MMSFGTFSFFYTFVFIWGAIGMLFIAVVVIKEMLQLNRKVDELDGGMTEEVELPELREQAKPVGSETVV